VVWDEERCLVDTSEGGPGEDMSIGSYTRAMELKLQCI
jgi:hypothetical protein